LSNIVLAVDWMRLRHDLIQAKLAKDMMRLGLAALKKDKASLLNFGFVYSFLVGFIIGPYLSFNPVTQWDAVGHLFSSWYIREFLFPRFSGWNPFFFAGYPQGMFYPPLMHYLTALLSYIFPITFALKSIVSICVLLTPLSFYRFARSQDLSVRDSSALMLAMVGLISAPIVYSSGNNFVGGTLSSTFHIGLIANAFALPLFFFYVSSLEIVASRGRSVAASLLLSALILSHTVTAIAAVVYLAIFFTLHLRSREIASAVLRHGFWTLLVTAFWWVPFLEYLDFSQSIEIRLGLGASSFILLMVGLGAALIQYLQPKSSVRPAVLFYFCAMTIGLLVLNFFPLRFHIYRLVLFPILLVPALCFGLLPKWRNLALSMLGIIGLCLGIISPQTSYHFINAAGFKQTISTQIKGPFADRTMVLASLNDEAEPHELQHQLPMFDRFHAIKGLFAESSRNSGFLQGLERLMDPVSMIWGVPLPKLITDNKADTSLVIRQRLKDFGVSSIIYARPPLGFEGEPSTEIVKYDLPWKFWNVNFSKLSLQVPEQTGQDYFFQNGRNLVLVERRQGLVNLSLYDCPTPLHSSAIITTEQGTFYVDRFDEQFILVRVMIPPAKLISEVFPALNSLKAYIADLTVSPEERQNLNSLLSSHEQELTTSLSPDTMSATFLETIQIPDKDESLVQGSRQKSLSRIDLPQTQLPEALPYWPQVKSKNWSDFTHAAFLDPTKLKIFVRSERELSKDSELPLAAKVSDFKITDTGEDFEFAVDSKQPVPILVKMSYFPKWHAFANGQPTPIYEASPSLMLVAATGHISFKYLDSTLEILANILSLLGIVVFGAVSLRARYRTSTRS
jgi:hypothetical protein